MIGEAAFHGLYLPWLMLLMLAAWPLLWLARRALLRAGAYRWVWHPALFDTALYVLLVYGLVRATFFFQS